MAGLNLRDNLSFSKKSDSRDGFIETVYIINISLSLLLSGMYHNEFLLFSLAPGDNKNRKPLLL